MNVPAHFSGTLYSAVSELRSAAAHIWTLPAGKAALTEAFLTTAYVLVLFEIVQGNIPGDSVVVGLAGFAFIGGVPATIMHLDAVVLRDYLVTTVPLIAVLTSSYYTAVWLLRDVNTTSYIATYLSAVVVAYAFIFLLVLAGVLLRLAAKRIGFLSDPPSTQRHLDR